MLSRGAVVVRRRLVPFLPPPPSPPTFSLSFHSASGAALGDPPSSLGPPPIRVALTESAGRGVFATRNIAAGELLHTAQPLVAHPSFPSRSDVLLPPSQGPKVCYLCLRRLEEDALPIGSSSDSNAGNRRFCSDNCRELSRAFYDVEIQADWSSFDGYCREQGLKYPLMAKRLACMVISNSVSAESLCILQPAILNHKKGLLMEEEFELLKSSFINSNVSDKLLTFLTKQWYFGVLARLRINSFRVELVGTTYDDMLKSACASITAEAAVGNAVYMLPSFYNHDCDPNAHIIWIDSAVAKMKALCNIESGEELRICYIDASMERQARQALLAEGFGFDCRCQRCLSDD